MNLSDCFSVCQPHGPVCLTPFIVPIHNKGLIDQTKTPNLISQLGLKVLTSVAKK